MMRSLSSAVAGLKTHQTKMDVIGNNIANVNTYGFKSGRTTFADVYYQNLSSGRTGTTGTKGGTNPTQIGYGSSVATIDVMMNVSSAASTGNAMDLYITGEGFIVSKDTSGQIYYSRLANLGFDSAGNLVDGNGNRIQGFPTVNGVPQISADGTIQQGDLQNIWVSPEMLDKLKDISISTDGAIIGLMDGDQQVTASSVPSWINANSFSIPANSVYSGTIRLAISGFCANPTMQTALTPVGGNITNMTMGTLALPAGTYDIDIDANNNVTMTFPGNTANNIDAVVLTGSLKNGKLVLANAKGEVGMTIEFDSSVTGLTAGTTTVALQLYEQMTTTDKGGNPVVDGPRPISAYPNDARFDELTFAITQDIASDPTFAGFNAIIGTAEPGEPVSYMLGNLALAKFPNASGLKQSGTSYFVESNNSGKAVFVRPGLEGTGSLKAGYLEQSNVDISQEMTDMITTQRGFQANSRIITVSDTMLEELVNLKR